MATRQRKVSQLIRLQYPTLPPMPNPKRFPVNPKGWKALKPLTGMPTVVESNMPGPIPAGLNATTPEWYVHYWLQKRNIDFDFQSSLMGGRIQMGGAVADFVLPTMVPPMILRVQGLAWHWGPFANRQKDQMQKDQLINLGYVVIDLDEDDVLNRLDYVMRLAMQQIDISRAVWSR